MSCHRFATLVRPVCNADGMDYADVGAIWDDSMVPLTPLEAGQDGHMQVKGGVCELGMSGTVLRCAQSAALDCSCVAGREYWDYESARESCDKTRYLWGHGRKRPCTADAHLQRTVAEQTWDRRYGQPTAEIGLSV